jgi:hypothetical protein
VAAGVAVPLIAWAVVILTVRQVQAAVLASQVQTGVEAATARGDALLPGLTAWHWALSALVLGFLLAALLGAIRSCRAAAMGVWLVVAMALLAGAQRHTIFWPSVFGRVLTTADVLRLACAAVVAVGGVLELRRIAMERQPARRRARPVDLPVAPRQQDRLCRCHAAPEGGKTW